MLLYVTRHGKTMTNESNRISGIVDVPLAPEGIKEAEALARRLSQEQERYRIRHIISSNLVRAQETARIVARALSLPVIVDSRFHEVSFGSDEGTLMSENPYQKLIGEPFSRFHDGESLTDAAVRVYPALDELKRRYQENVLLVTHGMLARVIDTYFHSCTIGEFRSILLQNCALVCYDMDRAERHLVAEREPFQGLSEKRCFGV